MNCKQVQREIVGQHKNNVGTSDRRTVRGGELSRRAWWIAAEAGFFLIATGLGRLHERIRKNWGQRNEQAQPFSSRYSFL